MKIAMTCQNRRTVTPHAGKCTHFFLFDTEKDMRQPERSIVLSPQQMFRHQAFNENHPLAVADALVTAGIGDGLHRQWQQMGKQVYVTYELDPVKALQAAINKLNNTDN